MYLDHDLCWINKYFLHAPISPSARSFALVYIKRFVCLRGSCCYCCFFFFFAFFLPILSFSHVFFSGFRVHCCCSVRDWILLARTAKKKNKYNIVWSFHVQINHATHKFFTRLRKNIYGKENKTKSKFISAHNKWFERERGKETTNGFEIETWIFPNTLPSLCLCIHAMEWHMCICARI